MKLSFRRITSSGNFIPEIDGLRFIAITSVVFFHLAGFLSVKDQTKYVEFFDFNILKEILHRGDLGVSLFFVISGFILGLPFARYYLGKGKKVSIKNYFIRRLSRLEPPYIIVMTTLLFATVFVAHKLSLADALKSYSASIFYLHNIIFGESLTKINIVTWSLEVEAQFYMLAPLMAYFFLIKNKRTKYVLLATVSILFVCADNFIDFPFITIINYLPYFLTGFILADIYADKITLLPATKFDSLIALIIFILIWLLDNKDVGSRYLKMVMETAQIASIFFFYYYVLIHKTFKILSMRVITNIGGMCYSIYLIHYPIISLFGNPLVRKTFSDNQIINTGIYAAILIVLVLVISSVFFLIAERPFMNKFWYKSLVKKFQKGY